jgi:hypothetical protein
MNGGKFMGMIISDQDLDAQIEQATKAGITALNEPRAMAARYDATRRQVVVELTNGCTFIFPADLGQGLANASDDELADVQVLGHGFGLHWEKLDADLSIASLVVGIFGSKSWMKELARRGGTSTSAAKAAAARSNGSKGGRPRKHA